MEQPVCPRCHSIDFTIDPLRKICRNCGKEFYLANASAMMIDDLTGEVTYRDISVRIINNKPEKRNIAGAGVNELVNERIKSQREKGNR